MIKLHPETAQAIASLINTIDASAVMCTRENDTDKGCYWLASEFKAIITLTEDYGIPHSGYAQAVKGMQMDMYANASLA
tara:strand:+ start:328 stop:564 length:237 start_codon:yes stop_codon:yes gene_type:complete